MMLKCFIAWGKKQVVYCSMCIKMLLCPSCLHRKWQLAFSILGHQAPVNVCTHAYMHKTTTLNNTLNPKHINSWEIASLTSGFPLDITPMHEQESLISQEDRTQCISYSST